MTPELLELEARTKGWLHPGEGECLNRWALKSPGTLLEIGSYCGKSTIWIADAAKQIRMPFVSVDWHRGNPEMAPGNDCFDPEVWDAELGTTDTIRHLRSTMHHAGFERTVSMICGTSRQVRKWWSTPLGFLFIDADHGTAAIDDYRAWAPILLPAGVLAFHDADAIPAILRACDEATKAGWVERENVRSLRVFTR